MDARCRTTDIGVLYGHGCAAKIALALSTQGRDEQPDERPLDGRYAPPGSRYGGVHRPVGVAVLPSVSVLVLVRHASPILLGGPG